MSWLLHPVVVEPRLAITPECCPTHIEAYNNQAQLGLTNLTFRLPQTTSMPGFLNPSYTVRPRGRSINFLILTQWNERELTRLILRSFCTRHGKKGHCNQDSGRSPHLSTPSAQNGDGTWPCGHDNLLPSSTLSTPVSTRCSSSIRYCSSKCSMWSTMATKLIITTRDWCE